MAQTPDKPAPKTPAMQQYARFKERHPDCVLLFRMGDFYEMFDEDAVTVSKALGLTLTQRTAGQPMAGVPYHQLDTYLKKLIAQGFRVAVCEQLQDASQAKGVVPRAVTRVLTPGTLVDDSLIEGESIGTLAAAFFTGSGDEAPASCAVMEVSTGDFVVLDADHDTIADELLRRGVRELLYASTADGKAPPRVERILKRLQISGTPRPAWHFRPQEAIEAVRKHFGVTTLAGFGLADDDPAAVPAGAIIRYLLETQTISEEDLAGVEGLTVAKATLAHIRPPRREHSEAACTIDAVSLRSLEIERTIRPGPTPTDGSLLGVFIGSSVSRGVCRTAMGKRLVRDWLCRPLRDAAAIRARQRIVATFIEDRSLAQQCAVKLDGVQDIARIAGRLAMGRAGPRDMVGLAKSLDAACVLAQVLEGAPALAGVRDALQAAAEKARPVAAAVIAGCVEDPPALARDGGIFRDGHDVALDEARLLQRDAGAWLGEYQRRLIEKHGLPNLKVGFNKVFGYYIELPAAQARQAPNELIRKQTLKNAERYTTPELREFEAKVTTAESRALDRERELFSALCEEALKVVEHIGRVSDEVAKLDVLLGFADKASRRGWTRPEIADEPVLRIKQGRHPVLDESLGSNFVPNDVELGVSGAIDDEAESGRKAGSGPTLALITGPNMAGKSTYIRQTALLTLLAHTGSFIPAESATIGVTDRIFTRIGADDALHAGQSTFMVEMIETANILNHATARSLVVLDEIGRGTSTLDGLSLAWAIAEFLAKDDAPRTLFATHYHELTDLEERHSGKVRNLHVEVREWPPGDPSAQIVFLHRILPGRTDQSYGVHVARLAGIPANVITRAREILGSLAVHHGPAAAVPEPAKPESLGKGAKDRAGQLALFTEYMKHPAVDALQKLKLDELTPLQAFDVLRQLKESAKDG